MGTSISQPSKRNTNWSPVHVAYKNKVIPEQRIINEVWRASENESVPISQSLKSDAVYDCYLAVTSSKDAAQAINIFNTSLNEKKHNSIIAEFGKRAIPAAFIGKGDVSTNWKSGFLSEVTNYVISRDASGFVGERYRNRTINELISFKDSISGKVANIVAQDSNIIKNRSDWNSFVDSIITKLKSNK